MSHMHVNEMRRPTGQSGLRDQNARLLLSCLRRHGALASAQLARRTQLTAQTVSNIARALEADGLLQREAAVRRGVGKPSVPLSLNPTGVYALGLSIGRRSLEMVLVDFLGRQIDAEVISYPFPIPAIVFGFVRSQTQAMLDRNGVARENVAGLGIARPNRIWEWGQVVNVPGETMKDWKEVDFVETFEELSGLDVVLENDATAACVAEQLLGRGHDLTDFVHIFMGTFVGGGLVLDGKVISGRSHNAAAMGPLPVPDGKGGVVQLLNVASLHVLETALQRAGQDSDRLRMATEDWSEFEPILTQWIDSTAGHLAIAAAAIASVVEVEAILIDGAFPPDVRTRLAEAVGVAFNRMDVTGIERTAIEPAMVGRRARSVGAALLPIHAAYFVS